MKLVKFLIADQLAPCLTVGVSPAILSRWKNLISLIHHHLHSTVTSAVISISASLEFTTHSHLLCSQKRSICL